MKNKLVILNLIFLIANFACSTSSEPDEEPTPTLLEPSKAWVQTISNVSASDAITLGKDGYLYASNYGTDIVYKIDKRGNSEIFISNQDGAAGIDFDDTGDMYLARYEAGDVVVISPEGEVRRVYATGLLGPIAIEFDATGNLFINNYHARYLSKVTTDGKLVNSFLHGFLNSSSLTFDDSGNIYLTSYENGRILKINSESGVVSMFLDSRVNGFGYITYANNELYATNIKGNKVYRISMEGNLEILAGTGREGLKDGSGDTAEFTRPIGIIANTTGDTLFVADAKAIRMITNHRD